MNIEIYSKEGRVGQIGEETAVTVGVFDGVHRGHQQLLKQLGAVGGEQPAASMAVTLTAHPSFVLGHRESEYWLDDPDEHLQLLFEAGAKYVAILPFTREVAQMTACEMVRWMFDELNMRTLLVGYDSRFGSKENDDFRDLPMFSIELGFTLQRGHPFNVDGEPISSSRIRQTLLDGRVEDTATLLGRNYSLSGEVMHGRGVGHTMGFPTANIDIAHTRKMLPKEGVYAVRMGGGKCEGERGIANLGAAPTFGVDSTMLEVHMIDYKGDIYGERVTVEFLHRIRDIQRFDSASELQKQLKEDIEEAHRW